MSRLVDFYRGTATDVEGRRLADLWAWGDDDLEAVHDFIQWLFPLPEPSRFNPDAPLLTPEDIAAFHAHPELRANLRRSCERILRFLGLAFDAQGAVVEGANFAARVPSIWAFPNHNWLRITRIVRSLALLGLTAESRSLFRRLEALYRSGRYPIPADTFRYWQAAAG